MTRTDQMLDNLDTRVTDLRKLAHRLKERADLDGIRITATETATIEHTRDIGENAARIDNHRRGTADARKLCDGRRDANANALGRIQSDIEAVLEAHTNSIFRLEAKLDRIAEQFAAAGFAPINDSDGEDVADADKPDSETPVHLTEQVIDAARNNTTRGAGPRPTVPAEQRLIS